MVDRIFALVSMLGVVAFCGVITLGVMEPDLWIVTVTVLFIAVIDFVRTFRDQAAKKAQHGAADSPTQSSSAE